MARLDELIPLLDQLDPVEREQLIHQLFSDPLFRHGLLGSERHTYATPDSPSVVSTPGICGGAARMIRTRIPVWTLDRMRQLGVSEVEILSGFPSLHAADLVQAWSYADSHRDEIDREIARNEQE